MHNKCDFARQLSTFSIIADITTARFMTMAVFQVTSLPGLLVMLIIHLLMWCFETLAEVFPLQLMYIRSLLRLCGGFTRLIWLHFLTLKKYQISFMVISHSGFSKHRTRKRTSVISNLCLARRSRPVMSVTMPSAHHSGSQFQTSTRQSCRLTLLQLWFKWQRIMCSSIYRGTRCQQKAGGLKRLRSWKRQFEAWKRILRSTRSLGNTWNSTLKWQPRRVDVHMGLTFRKSRVQKILKWSQLSTICT